MFEIVSNGNIDDKIFNEMYKENKEIIDSLIFYMEQNPKMVEIKLEEISYDKIYELLIFLNNCKINYTVIFLISAIEGYLEKKEDELFLDLYLAYQNGDANTWIDERTLPELNILRKAIQNDSSFESIFSDLSTVISNKIK